MVFISMFRGQSPLSLLILLFVANCSVGCLSNKKDEVAVEAAAPPPAAYPSTPEGYADTGSTAPVPPSSTMAPAPAAPEPPQFSLREGETLVTYRIEMGDNLSKIATKYNTSVSRIKAANGMTNDKIFAGKTLQIPTAAPPGLAMNAPTPSASNPNSFSSSGDRYGSAATTDSSGAGSYTSSSAPAPSSFPSYPSTTDVAPASSAPASTSYPRVSSPPIPPQNQQPAGAFPTPNFGSGTGVQFSE
ncbi:MAG: LysM peptidoglycan-binding domain-containing protein [Verrucomicrobiales bacterium]|nr:LysM peptidoglycan-binding domain-containing protein [Verrucomicrobiales bacterium]